MRGKRSGAIPRPETIDGSSDGVNPRNIPTRTLLAPSPVRVNDFDTAGFGIQARLYRVDSTTAVRDFGNPVRE